MKNGYSKTEQNCKGCFGPCGMCTEVESFLSANAAYIPPQHRAHIREAIVKGSTALAIELTPYHLRPGLRAALEADYCARVAGQKFTLKKEYLP